MTEPTDTRYNFTEVEPRIYRLWKERGCFCAAHDEQGNVVDSKRAAGPAYSIVIPPPNVTGRLHMGHALNNTIQDMLTRYKRMDGCDTLWQPGTDHAGIATQTVVKKMLDSQGVDYHELGREKFVDKVWQWRAKYGDMILNQLEKIGSSCDWERTRFTMDEGLCKAVTFTFKKLYDAGLVYRGKRIVNWCPVDKTALSDDEVETKEGGEAGFLWQIKYQLADGSGFLTVATTRPETLFGDVAVAVNPKDERFSKYIGQKVIVPLQGRVVPVIGDEYVDIEFGTGCLKITPAHDLNDFEIGTRHKLAPVNVMNEDATMNEIVPEQYRGLDRFKCREKAVAELKEKELLVSEEARQTPLGRSYRSGAVIEYRLSDQWFVKMKPLAEEVLKLHGDLNIQPPRWNKVYLDWLTHIRDWCISRQIWWGHRIPAWYCESQCAVRSAQSAGMDSRTVHGTQRVSECPPIVSETPPIKCPTCGSTNLTQETDVLDTWFSAALWPMSTLGWPQKTPDLARYFPTSTLVTGKDIIFFWVARMNMMAAHFTGKLPYKNVYINPIVLDEKGETMSKSKGNGIDPLVVVNGATLEELKETVMEARPSNTKEIIKRLEKNFPQGYEGVGADALRYTLIYLCSGGQQLKISLTSFHDLGRRFMTKLWNAARFIFMHMKQDVSDVRCLPSDVQSLQDEDVWIRARLKITVGKVRRCLDEFDFVNLNQVYYQFVWNDFCDWYVELCKVRLTAGDAAQKRAVLDNLVNVFAQMLKLLHPLIPFITEELWGKLRLVASRQSLVASWEGQSGLLMLTEFPKASALTADEEAVIRRFDILQDVVGHCRRLRKMYQIKDTEHFGAYIRVKNNDAHVVGTKMTATLCRLAGLSGLTVLDFKDNRLPPGKMVTMIDSSFELLLNIADYIDVAKEKERLAKEIDALEKRVISLAARLANPDFCSKAEESIVVDQQKLLKENQDKLIENKALLREINLW